MEVQKKSKRSTARFNIIDFMIILIALLCVVSLLARYTTVLEKMGISDHLQQYEVSFTVTDLRYTTPNFFRTNDKIYLQDEEQTYMGTLLSREMGSTDALTITLSSRYVQAQEGFISAYYMENTFVDISGRILCEGIIGDDGYFLLGGNMYLAEGQKLAVCTDLVSFELTVTGIVPANTENSVAN